MIKKIHESEYGGGENNFHISKSGNTLDVVLTYPPCSDADNTNNQCRYVTFDQEATRASDGIRIHYDYQRDGYVIEQPKNTLTKIGDRSYTDVIEWIEVGFFQSWQFHTEDSGEVYMAADAAYDGKA